MKKGINESMRIETVPDLLRRVEEEYQKRKKEVAVKQEANKKALNLAVEKERGLIKEMDASRRIVARMEKDFHSLEEKIEKEQRAQIEKVSLREKDVKSGKASLRQFQQQGTSEANITKKAIEKTTLDLRHSLSTIRAKNLEILKLEESLGECRNTVRGLVIQPGIFMLDVLKHLYSFTDEQVASFMAEMESYRSEWTQAKQRLMLADGKSLSDRNVWHRLTAKDARRLQFSPLLPMTCVEKLKTELAKHEDKERVSITYYVRSKDIDISAVTARRGLIQTGQLREDKHEKFKREKTKY